MKKQVIVIHGGDSFNVYEDFLESLKNMEVSLDSFRVKDDWKSTIAKELGSNFDVLNPRMPNKYNAKYPEWRIWFERMFPFIEDEVILIGHSQGGIFLAKYLSENNFPKKIGALMFVAAPHSKSNEIGDFTLSGSLENVTKQCSNIHLYQSEDDPVVCFSEVERYKKDIPDAEMHIFKDRGHFRQKNFPEIVEEIKNI